MALCGSPWERIEFEIIYVQKTHADASGQSVTYDLTTKTERQLKKYMNSNDPLSKRLLRNRKIKKMRRVRCRHGHEKNCFLYPCCFMLCFDWKRANRARRRNGASGISLCAPWFLFIFAHAESNHAQPLSYCFFSFDG